MTSDDALEAQLTEVLDELITLVQEAKQAEWSTTSDPRHSALDDLTEFLHARLLSIAEVEERLTGHPPSILSPSARRPRNLAAEAGGDADRLVGLLVEDLEIVAADVRSRAPELEPPWRERMDDLAVGLERSAASLREGGAG